MPTNKTSLLILSHSSFGKHVHEKRSSNYEFINITFRDDFEDGDREIGRINNM